MKPRTLLKLSLFLLTTYILVHLIVYTIQEKFIFLEKTLHADYHFNFEQDFEEHFFKMENGEQINALFFQTKDQPKGTILYFHGNADNLKRWGNYANTFTKRGYNILMIDYRGYGKSEGTPSESNLYEDGQKAYDWLLKKTPGQDLIVYGRSLGSGVACHVAANNPASLLILETPFNNMKAVVETRYPFLYLRWPFRHQFPNDENIKKVNYPIHIFHGTQDKVVPLECAQQLKVNLKPKDHFYTIENGGHKNLDQFPAFNTALDQILN